jgi:hypothetical protein
MDRLKHHNAKTSKSFREAACEIVKASFLDPLELLKVDFTNWVHHAVRKKRRKERL